MARSAITVQETIRTGLTPAYAACNVDGNSWDNSGENSYLHIKNGSGGAIVVTIPTPGFVDTDLAIADRTISIGAGAEAKIGPFRNTTYKQDSDNTVHIDYASVTSMTIGIFKLSNA